MVFLVDFSRKNELTVISQFKNYFGEEAGEGGKFRSNLSVWVFFFFSKANFRRIQK